MKTTTQSKKELIITLRRQLMEAEAGQAHVFHFADAALDKASEKYCAASGVILTLAPLGRQELFRPVLIRDGLSDTTIAALRADFRRSYELATLYKPR